MTSQPTSNPVYKLDTIPSAGLGTTATAFIPKGTLLIAESPLFTAEMDQTGKGTLAAIRREIGLLSADQQRTFFSLYNAYGEPLPPEIGITRTNGIKLGTSATRGGVFVECSRFNHSCDPNANYSWNSALSKEVIYAIKDITPGEQITVSYLPSLLLSRSERRQILLNDYLFTCCCSACERTPQEVYASDVRRVECDMLNDAVWENDLDTLNPAKALGYCKKVLQLMKEEGLAYCHLTYWTALLICIEHGDLARASAFAVLAMKDTEMAEGKDSTELKETKSYIKHPEKHPISRILNNKIWRSRVKSKPAMDCDGFEEWLWRRAV